MRADLSTIQQTLTPEASSVLNHSIAEAGRRNHGQTSPLHVAATLLATPSGLLRQACIRSHPNSTHPLQCRALELCFGVALERLPTAQNAAKPGSEPPISNSLMAALKRAQANQRRGCPEQQQQPLLAIKVELEQLIISILDDPGVSRVMREASFSSPAVKASIEESMNSSTPQTHQQHQVGSGNVSIGTSFGGILPRIPSQLPTPMAQNPFPALQPANRNVYRNPRLQPAGTGETPNKRGEDVKKVMEIMVRSKKRNPILVGDAELESLVKELLSQIENKEMGTFEVLRNVQIICLEKGYFSDKNRIQYKIKELGGLIESKIGSGGVILDLGDLKWLVEQPVSLCRVQQQQVISETGRAAVVEMGSLLARFGGGGGDGADNKLWLIGTATCETYLRCQVYHSTMENDWDLQAVPIASKSPLPGLFPRSNHLESLAPLKVAATPLHSLTKIVSDVLDPTQLTAFCPECTEKYEIELLKLTSVERSFSESKQEGKQQSLPQWLQKAKLISTDAETMEHSQGKKPGSVFEQKSQEIRKKWKDTCLYLHPNFHQNNGLHRPDLSVLSVPSLLNPNTLLHSPFQTKLRTKKPLGESLMLNLNQVTSQRHAQRVNTPPRGPVQTDLVIGREGTDRIREESTEDQAKDFLSCISSKPQTKFLDKLANLSDVDTSKKLLKGLMEKAWWQAEAASAVASAITRCRLGNGKRRGGGSRGDVWLLFMGHDRVAKRKMASVLAAQICGASSITICLGSRRDYETDFQFRGKTVIDRISEAIRRNPVSVIILEDIDEADILVRGSIKRALDRGRLTDSHCREVGLGNTIFVLTGDWSFASPQSYGNGHVVDEKKLISLSSGSWRLGLIVREKSSKRRAPWFQDVDRTLKPRKEVGSDLSLDLNLAAAATEDENMDGSHNSSSLTVEYGDELNLVNPHFSVASVPRDLVDSVDDSILFKPVDLAFVRREIKKTISVKFSVAVEDKLSIEVEDDIVEKILGGLWHDDNSLEEWIGGVLAPSFDQLKAQLTSGDCSRSVVRLVVESDHGNQEKCMANGNWLPRSIIVQGL